MSGRALKYGEVIKVEDIFDSTVLADFDFETYSSAGMYFDPLKGRWVQPKYCSGTKKGISVITTQAYAEHPSTEVLILKYNLKDGFGTYEWSFGDPPPQKLFDHIAAGKLIEAWNVMFEERIWNEVCVKKYGWPVLPVKQLRCAMAKSRAFCYPGALAKAGPAAGLSDDLLKDKEGTRLLNKFSVPRNPTKADVSLRNHVDFLIDEDSKKLAAYCEQDLVTEEAMSIRTPDLNELELAYWQMDQECNRVGVKLDTESIDAALKILDEEYAEAAEEIAQITNGVVTSFTQIQKIKAWLWVKDVKVGSVDASTVDELLQRSNLPDEVRRVLELRSAYGSAAVKKLYAMKVQQSAAGRATDMFIYHSARTGRDAGAGIQPQNMPNSGPEVRQCPHCKSYTTYPDFCRGCSAVAIRDVQPEEWSPEAAEFALKVLRDGTIKYFFSSITEVLSGCLRGLFISDPGHDFVGSDYSSIEAVVAACLTGCHWRIETFRNGGDIYLASISQITGTSIEEYAKYKQETGQHHPDRKKGKVAELASGYQGWMGAWKQFGADAFFNSDDELVAAIKAWRKASPEIVRAWGGQPNQWRDEYYGLEGNFILAHQNEGQHFTPLPGITYMGWRGKVYCFLPSGRAITYHDVQLSPNYDRPGQMRITFMGYNTNPKMGAIGWTRMDTYGGKLFENVVQGTARDIMAYAAVNLHQRGYKIMLRVHDELITQVPEGWGSVEEMEQIGGMLPAFASNWPVKMSGGWRDKRFRK